MGGGAMTAALAPHFDLVIASDSHPDLILMWQALQQGWVPPSIVTEDDYNALRHAEPSALRGFVGFGGASWGGKWFGGYARGGNRNYADESTRGLVRDIKLMSNVVFLQRDYRDISVAKGDTIYADPPYAETTSYSTPFDNSEFWEVADAWVNGGANVFVSEYSAPKSWDCVWETTRTRDMKSQLTNPVLVTERLFYKGEDINFAHPSRGQQPVASGDIQANREALPGELE
jgi:DNA adenine methylase